ncbi:helix-turn-helix domain-containing protein [Streptomyces sp. NPDC058195]|uniref:helix-turn-helix domain-containing protein n=1 Tax=Streptomyces sp. NPDC058195 TaxID=3346375 RepID=UPI0036F0B0C0
MVSPSRAGPRGGIWGYHDLPYAGADSTPRLLLPTGAVALGLAFTGSIHLTGATVRGPTAGFTSFVAGSHSGALVYDHDDALTGIGVFLAPWVAYTLFGIPMDGLANTVVPAFEVLGPRVDTLVRELREAPDRQARFRHFDGVLARWMSEGPAHAEPVEQVWWRLARSRGDTPMPGLAREVGWCQRQLERRFREQVGLSPKVVARIMRLQYTVRLLLEGWLVCDAAAEAGYHDQSHLSREFRKMTGLSPRRFTACARKGENSQSYGFLADRPDLAAALR